MSTILSVTGLGRRFGPTWALRDVDLSLGAGEVVALLGQNGAGKSTLIKLLAGADRPTTGVIHLGEQRFAHGLSAEAARAHGLAFVHQDLALLGPLSVAENIAHVAGFERRGGLIRWRAQQDAARRLLARWEMDVDPTAPVDALDAAQRALVAIARAMATEPAALVLDEPTAALTAHESELLYGAVERLRDGGVGVIYVTHRFGDVRRLAGRAAVLRDGRLVADLSVAGTSEDELVRAIVGSAPAARASEPAPERVLARAETPVLRLRGVAGGEASGTDLDVAGGEVVGLVGLVGAGHRSVGRIVAGALPASAGSLELSGRAFRPRSPRDAQRLGVSYSPGDRLREAAFPTLDSAINLTTRARRLLQVVRPSAERTAAAEVLDDWEVTPNAPGAVFATLSGGNQQKVLLAKWMTTRPLLFVADEPTAGVDVGAKAAIYERIAAATREGLAVLLISSDAEAIVAIADRAIVFRHGRPAAQLAGAELTVERIALESQSDMAVAA